MIVMNEKDILHISKFSRCGCLESPESTKTINIFLKIPQLSRALSSSLFRYSSCLPPHLSYIPFTFVRMAALKYSSGTISLNPLRCSSLSRF